MIKILAACALALWAMPPAAAQPNASEVSITFSVYAQSRLQNLVYFDGREWAPVRFYSSSPSERFAYRGGAVLQFYDGDQVNSAREEGKEPVAVARFAIPEDGGREFFLFFVRDPAVSSYPAADAYRIFGFTDSLGERPPQTITLFNASGRTLFAEVGGRRFEATGGRAAPVAVERETRVRLAVVGRQRPALFYDQPLSLERGERILFVVFPPFVAGTVALQTRILRDRLGAPDDGAQPSAEGAQP